LADVRLVPTPDIIRRTNVRHGQAKMAEPPVVMSACLETVLLYATH
jgi:hypothetical protein